MTPNEFINFILYPEFKGWLLVFKIIFLAFLAFFVGFTLWGLICTSWLKRIFLNDFIEFILYRPIEKEEIKRKWKKIKNRLLSGIDAEIKLAILEADELFISTLEKKGIRGKSFEEILEKIPQEFELNLESLKKAHQLRDDIVEDPSLKIELEKAKEVISIFESALKKLDEM
jgi:biopolymer transport protein ExbB/TolQ